jgi:nucleotide-binding universal stress UspA family protein
MYHSILVAQDASEYSKQALGLAIWLAKATRARLHLIHLHSRKPRIRPKTSLDEMSSIMQVRLEQCRDKGITGDCQVVEGWSTKALVSESKWHDLVVVGRHGVSARGRARGIGSLPTALLAASPVPVLVAADTPVIPDRLLVAFDNSPDACMALRIAASLAAERRLRIHVIEAMAGHGRQDHLAHARAYLEGWEEVDADFEVLEGKSSEQIVSCIVKHGIQLTFVPALDRSVLGHHLTTRIAQETGSSLIVPRGRTQPVY